MKQYTFLCYFTLSYCFDKAILSVVVTIDYADLILSENRLRDSGTKTALNGNITNSDISQVLCSYYISILVPNFFTRLMHSIQKGNSRSYAE